MEQGKQLAKKIIWLTGASLLIRAASSAFQMALSKVLGAETMGVYYLVASVYVFAATFAIAGSRFAATRLTAECLGRGDEAQKQEAIRGCLRFGFCFAAAATALLFFGAPLIGGRLLGDDRAVPALRVLALCLVPLSLGAVLGGYFMALGRVKLVCILQLTEEGIRIGLTLWLLKIGLGRTEGCTVIALGTAAGEVGSFLVGLFFFLREKPMKAVSKKKSKIAPVALPLAGAALVRTGLGTVQSVLVNHGFRQSGGASAALEKYGLIQGMVFPLIAFPASLFSSGAELAVPDLTEAQVQGQKERIRLRCHRLVILGAVIAAWFTAVFFFFGHGFSQVIYHSDRAGAQIVRLALLLPALYLDTLTDGLLRGLNQQVYAMKCSIADSLLSTALIFFLLPRYGLSGYVFILYVSAYFNFIASFLGLCRETGLHFPRGEAALSFAAAFGSTALSRLACRFFGISLLKIPGFIAGIALSALLFGAFLWLRGVLMKKTEKLQKNTFPGEKMMVK